MKPETASRFLRRASVLALLALVLMMWSIFDPRPAPVLIALTVGQVLGTLSLAGFIFVVVHDLRARRR
jgi:hypothetical protein